MNDGIVYNFGIVENLFLFPADSCERLGRFCGYSLASELRWCQVVRVTWHQKQPREEKCGAASPSSLFSLWESLG